MCRRTVENMPHCIDGARVDRITHDARAVHDAPLKLPRSLDVMADPVFLEMTQAIRRHFNDPWLA
jgi:hypothetical protein